MAKNMPLPWIKETVTKCLEEPSRPVIRRTKITQVIRVFADSQLIGSPFFLIFIYNFSCIFFTFINIKKLGSYK